MTGFDIALGHAERGIPMAPVHGVVDGRCDCSDLGCGSPGKHPWTRSGLNDASTDPDVLRRWNDRWPGCNWAARTGVRFDVLDLDGTEAHAAAAWLRDQGRMPVIWRIVETGRPGGLHLYLPRTGHGGATGGKAGWPPHVDYRGRGGYVLVEGSRHVLGRSYRLRDGVALPELDAVADRVPVSIRMPWEGVAPKSSPKTLRSSRPVQGDGTTSEFGRTRLEEVCAELRSRPAGSREVFMSTVAVMTAARLIDSGHLDRLTAISAIEDAAESCGLERSEVAKVERVLRKIDTVTHPLAPDGRSDVEKFADWIARQPLVKAHAGFLKALRSLAGPDRAADAAVLADGARRAGIPDHLVRAAVDRALTMTGATR